MRLEGGGWEGGDKKEIWRGKLGKREVRGEEVETSLRGNFKNKERNLG